ncbi:hypothetical protein GGU10DRAFT_330941 [Lentinula aff. detonsa]|uniref:Uncharacterized protein n=1 Tax=Lentinula aff. detonsa TaxID=2804958 RepID=A0AA38NN76_9AGAR|nr:hypothetical protein GGU10DRAFT_330941 [Lentinula aff. detonsa]
MSSSLLHASAPQKRKLDSGELSINIPNNRNVLTICDDHEFTVKPPKLRRILAKHSNDIFSDTSFSNTSEPSFLESVTERINLLHRDATAQMDKPAHIIEDIYDINGEEDKLAWPLNVPPKEHVIIAPNQRHSSSPLASKSPTPLPSAPPTITLAATRLDEPLELSSSSSTSSSTSLPTLAAPVVKTEAEAGQIPPYKKLPSRGDSVQKRIAKLQADPWSDPLKLTAKSVFCVGCQKSVCLDKRFDYYPGFWETHKRRCPFVQNGKLRQGKSVDHRDNSELYAQDNRTFQRSYRKIDSGSSTW